MGKVRTSRFHVTEPKNRVVLTQRDRAMIERIYQRGLMNTTQLVDLFSDPGRHDPRQRPYAGNQYRTIAQRLRKLQTHQLISTLEAQRRAFLHDFENDSKVYVITDKSVSILEEMGYVVPQTNYTELARRRISYQHDLDVSEIYTRFLLSARARDIPYRSYKEVIEAIHGSEKYPFKPRRWELFQYKTEHGTLVPDDLFVLEASKRLLFFVEVDRNTEPNISGQRKKTIHNTLEKYIALYREKKRIEPYGVDRFRVLFVTKSDQHIAHIIKLIKDFGGEIFCFTTFQAIGACPDLLSLEWRTNKSNRRQLL
jgi:hypothetical protein